MGQLSHQAAASPEDFCYFSADSCRNICILPGCWCPSAGAELGWEDAVLFHRCWKRRELAHELLVCSWAKSEHVGRERREAQKPNEFSRGRRRINLPSRRSLTGKLCITWLSLIVSLSHPPFPALCTPQGPFAPFPSPFQPADPIAPLLFPSANLLSAHLQGVAEPERGARRCQRWMIWRWSGFYHTGWL